MAPLGVDLRNYQNPPSPGFVSLITISPDTPISCRPLKLQIKHGRILFSCCVFLPFIIFDCSFLAEHGVCSDAFGAVFAIGREIG